MKEITVRRMQAQDLPAAVLLDWMSFSLPWPTSAFARELESSYTRVWVAETKLEEALEFRSPVPIETQDFTRQTGEMAVIGVLVIWMIVDEAHIATLAVHPRMRECGVARQMLLSALSEAAREGALSALLEVRSGNVAAQKLYQSLGFEIVGRRPHYYKDNFEDALLMTLPAISALDFAREKEIR